MKTYLVGSLERIKYKGIKLGIRRRKGGYQTKCASTINEQIRRKTNEQKAEWCSHFEI